MIVFQFQHFYCAVVYLLYSLHKILASLNSCHIFLENITGLLAVFLHVCDEAVVAAVAESRPVAAFDIEVLSTGLLAVDGHPLDILPCLAVAQICPAVAGGIIRGGVGTDCPKFAKAFFGMHLVLLARGAICSDSHVV
jgi:hypothetical protein